MEAKTLGRLFSTAFFCCLALLSQARLEPVNLTCEYLKNPLPIDKLNPRLAWVNVAAPGERGQRQTAWQIQVATSKQNLSAGKADLWDSGKVISGESNHIAYAGKPLLSRQDCWWRVMVWDKNGGASEWSEPAFWGMGLLNENDWKAQWIGAPWQTEEGLPSLGFNGFQHDKRAVIFDPAPMFRKEFMLEKEVVSAKVYVTGMGYFQLFLNGGRVGEDYFVPNQTDYGRRNLPPNYIHVDNNFSAHRVLYLAYDLTDLLKKGNNTVGAMLGNGFYQNIAGLGDSYGAPRLLAQIQITFADGSETVISTDESWKVTSSPITSNFIYFGEHYDARLEQPGWNAPGFDDSKWQSAVLRKAPGGALRAQMSPPDRFMESLPSKKIERLGEGHFKVGFGQEISGWVKLNAKGEAGRKIEMRFNNPNTGFNTWIMKGRSWESYVPGFCWFVFSEVEIFNYPGELKPENIHAEAVYTAVETTGKFTCSNPLFNQINQIYWRSQTDNLHGGISSDCPHRERLGYTGDAQAACVTMMHNFGAAAFYQKWMQDMLDAQNPANGYVPNTVPFQNGGGGPAWGAAIVIIPWEFYLHYGDKQMLERNFEGMKKYVGYLNSWAGESGIMRSQAPRGREPNFWLNLGDWCVPGLQADWANAASNRMDSLVQSFYLWRCADLTAKIARILGKNADAATFSALAEKTRAAFHKTFFQKEKGSYGKHGCDVFALVMGVPDERRAQVLESLQAEIAANGGNLTTGIFGTQFLFETLTENGLNELAFSIMNSRTQPSYGWWLEQGATTTWEQWNGDNSRNHPMFGGGLTWFYRKLAGLRADPEQPGYWHFFVKPQPAGDLNFASYSTETPFGMAAVDWKKKAGTFHLKVIVPVGSTATVFVPAKSKKEVLESGTRIGKNGEVVFSRMEKDYAIFKIGSGEYKFESR